jgi:hypothetical protein
VHRWGVCASLGGLCADFISRVCVTPPIGLSPRNPLSHQKNSNTSLTLSSTIRAEFGASVAWALREPSAKFWPCVVEQQEDVRTVGYRLLHPSVTDTSIKPGDSPKFPDHGAIEVGSLSPLVRLLSTPSGWSVLCPPFHIRSEVISTSHSICSQAEDL